MLFWKAKVIGSPGRQSYMKACKLLDRPLYDGYTQARKILNSGGGSGKEKPGEA
ncbi:hypothetical protein GCM10028824_35880 [Hymenobacter segetis]